MHYHNGRGATLFSGGGGVEAMLKDSIQFTHAVEYDPAIAEVYRQNHGGHVQVADVCDVDYSAWGALDYLHASPVCKNASQAKTDGEESDTDIKTAMAVVRCLEETQPRVFTLENVGGYRTFSAYRRICQALDRGGYMWHAEVLNSADFGVPQTRRRLILRAVRDSLLPTWPAPVPWVGWYAAIEDILDTLPPSQFAPWQLERLPEEISDSVLVYGDNTQQEYSEPYSSSNAPARTVRTSHPPRAFIVPIGTESQVRFASEPMHTTTSAHYKNMPRAWFINEDSKMGILEAHEPAPTQVSSARARKARALLVDGDGNRSREPTVLDQDKPSMTIQAWHGRRPIQTPRTWLSQGRVVKMTPRALARFQSIPDDFILPEKASLACTVIGNAVPSLLMREIVRPLL